MGINMPFFVRVHLCNPKPNSPGFNVVSYNVIALNKLKLENSVFDNTYVWLPTRGAEVKPTSHDTMFSLTSTLQASDMKET
jgi:hypothetical protein